MPQMMPLMWGPLFLMFTLILMISLSKIYFSANKTLENENYSQASVVKKLLNWTW
uniref:ATP synthase F0 subunit 8 n=1 Tax=Homidia socia TaxID=301514 RepID=A0A6G6A5Z5_9HEXA|nr:ATP synthase F0 subunit 8 [Homidia socia]